MNVLAAAAARLSRQDMLQGMTVLLAALCLVLALRWPSGAALVNDSWYVLAPVRCALLALAGLAWGTALGCRPRQRDLGEAYVPSPHAPPLDHPGWRYEVLATLVAVVGLVVVTTPFDVLTYAATYPTTSLAWSLAAPLLAAVGYFGLGLALGRLARLSHTVALLPLLVPAVLAGAVWLDLALGVRLLNAYFAAVEPSVYFAVVMSVLSVVAVVVALRPRIETP